MPAVSLEEIHLTFEDNGQPLRYALFTEYVVLFEAVYYILKIEKSLSEEDMSNLTISKFQDLLGRQKNRRISDIVLPHGMDNLSNPGENDLTLHSIWYQSPMEWVLTGISVALTGAVILSGGRIEISHTGFKAQLPPIGEGVKKLRQAFGVKTTRKQKRPPGEPPLMGFGNEPRL
jgi:hypothetical protein